MLELQKRTKELRVTVDATPPDSPPPQGTPSGLSTGPTLGARATTTPSLDPQAPSGPPLPSFLNQPSASHHTPLSSPLRADGQSRLGATRGASGSFQPTPDAPPPTPPHGSGAQDGYAGMQGYLSHSDQFFFTVTKFSVWGVSGLLGLLGILFFGAGFLTAFWLIADANVINNNTSVRQQREIDSQENVLAEQAQLLKAQRQEDLRHDDAFRRLGVDPGHHEATLNHGHQSSSAQPFLEAGPHPSLPEPPLRLPGNAAPYMPPQSLRERLREINTPIAVVQKSIKDFNSQLSLHSVVLGSFSSSNEAIKQAQLFELKGYSVFVIKNNDPQMGARHFVLLGAYPSNTFAQQVANDMANFLNRNDITTTTGIIKTPHDTLIYPRIKM